MDNLGNKTFCRKYICDLDKFFKKNFSHFYYSTNENCGLLKSVDAPNQWKPIILPNFQSIFQPMIVQQPQPEILKESLPTVQEPTVVQELEEVLGKVQPNSLIEQVQEISEEVSSPIVSKTHQSQDACECASEIVGAQQHQSHPRSHQRKLLHRITKPYLGHFDEKQWDKKGIMGQIMRPIEDVYFAFLPDDEMVQMINTNLVNEERLIT